MAEDKEGKYCTVCGGVVPDSIKIRKIVIEGKEIGIDQLDMILTQVQRLMLSNENRIMDEILIRVKVFNYIPTKKITAYREAFLTEYRKMDFRGKIG
ncbi:MAG: NAC family transcription factor [Methanomicrobiales archaeon]|nr:NAC family transcription factor [Methanomicrobiales archaeon]